MVSAWAVGLGGVAEGLFKMALGNGIGVRVDERFTRDLFAQEIGGILRSWRRALRTASWKPRACRWAKPPRHTRLSAVEKRLT